MTSTVLEWLASYLTDRQQLVRHSGLTSSTTLLTCGVPQGSVLGPILFILYTADVSKIIQRHGLHHHLYADDAQIYGFCRHNSIDTQRLREKLMACISEVAGWMKSNRLRFNSAKTEFVWLTSPRRLCQLDSTSFTVGTDIVQPSHVVRNLGLQLDKMDFL